MNEKSDIFRASGAGSNEKCVPNDLTLSRNERQCHYGPEYLSDNSEEY